MTGHDLIVQGGGPGGYTAALYGATGRSLHG
jgi:thioredoxin reductase